MLSKYVITNFPKKSYKTLLIKQVLLVARRGTKGGFPFVAFPDLNKVVGALEI